MTDKTFTATASNRAHLQLLYPWLVWLLGAAFFFYKYFLQVSPGVMAKELMQTFQVTGAGLGNLAACFFYAYLIMQIPVGMLLDHFSPRRLTALAILICSIGAIIFAQAQSLVTVETSRGLIGLGAAFSAVSCFKLATLWFPPKRFALIAGLSMTAGMLGAIYGEAPLAAMISAWGWRDAMFYSGLIGLGLAILFFCLVRDKSTYEILHIHHPQELPRFSQSIKSILCSKQAWLLSVYSGLAFAPISVFGGLWGVPFLEQAHHVTRTTAAAEVSSIFIGFAIGCPIAGWFSDFIQNRRKVMFAGTWFALITITLVLYYPSLSTVSLSLLLFSFGIGASCFFLCFSMIREIHSILLAATALGFMNTFDSLCEALSEPLIGKILDVGWAGQMLEGVRVFSLANYHLALSLLPIYFIVALAILYFIKETHCKQL